MHRPLVIDTRMHGAAGITGVFVVRGEATALVEVGPKTSAGTVLDALERAGIESVDWVVVTHIHLDHAGAAGTLARRFPEARVAVHRAGARHLVDPSRLWASATRIYGDAMESLWGGIDPIDPERVHPLDDGDKIDLGGRSLEAIETPGHARHHHALLDDATGMLFVGDALGVRLQTTGVLRPATPPPELDLELAVSSIERIRAMSPASLMLTHFGPNDSGADPWDVDDTCRRAVEALNRWAEWVGEARGQRQDRDAITARVRARARASLERDLSEDEVDLLEKTTSYEMNVSGYLRYFDRPAQTTAAKEP